MATQSNHSLHEQSKGFKSLTKVPSKRHKHQWVLIKQGDTRPKYRPLPKGQWVSRGGLFGGTTYIPGFDHQMLMTHIVDTIQNSELPYYTYQTWQCPECGELKEHSQRHAGITELLSQDKGNDLAASNSKPPQTHTKSAQSSPEKEE